MDLIFNNLNSELLIGYGFLPIVASILVHFAFSAAVFNDAQRLQRDYDSLVFVNSWLWSLAVLVGGVFVALAYWVIHHSAIAKR